MGTDFSRVRLDPLLDYAGVELKQGAVLLDGDVNEGTDIVDRRLRALAGDLAGRVTVSETTPDAFEILPAGGGLTIGVGRLYVDGLLAQCHGGDPAVAADRVFDPVLAEPGFANPLAYGAQPYLRQPPALPTSGLHLVYLDVWNREVTFLEQPDLVEIAVGVEATSRVQTVWQVRVLDPAAGAGATCATPDAELPGWAAITAPSTGSLTTGTFAVAIPTDPCELPPTGGYRGLENQLYRVEIHNPGTLGVGATFKWSRVNASVGSRVAAIVSATELELDSIGRDDILSFKSGDWVEIIDDFREFAGLPGDIRKVAVDAARRRITFAPALSADLLPSPAGFPNSVFPAARNQRVRRWDQSGAINRTDPSGTPVQVQDLDAAGSTGLIAVPSPATELLLENGVTVRFDPGATGFRAGDYWVFAARTADASVEELDRAPPRGVHHHYARLAMWDAGAGTITDCRPKKGAGCCTFVVRPGESIQAAIDNLPPVGGCVCLKAGLHLVDDTIVIARSNVTLHGESMGAIVRNDRGGTVLLVGQAQVGGTREVRVASIVFQQGEEGGGAPVVGLANVESVVIDDCRLEAPGRRFGEGLIAFGSADVTISGCVVTGAAIGAWCFGRNRDVTIAGCEFRASADAETALGIGILAQAMAGPVTIEDNLVLSPLYGIVVDDDPNAPASNARTSRICGNRVGIVGSPDLPQRVFAIDVASEASVVNDNQVEHRGGNIAGIRLCGNGSAAHGNFIRRRGREQASPATGAPAPEASIAIMAGFQGAKGYLPLERLTIADNVVEGMQHGIALGGVTRSRVSGNILGDGALLAVNGIAAHQSSECVIAENIIVRHAFGVLLLGGDRNMIGDNRLDGGGFGIAAMVEEAPTISGNRLTDLTLNGILLWSAAQRCNVIENRIVRCGSAAAVANGIGAWGILGELHVESNEVMDLGAGTARLAYGIAGDVILEARVESNLVTYSSATLRNVAGEDRALLMRGWFDVPGNDSTPGAGFAIQIANNKFVGPGATALVELYEQQINDNIFVRFERVLFHGNYCAHFSTPFRPGTPTTNVPAAPLAATVKLVGRNCSVTGNHVRATTPGFPSYRLLDRALGVAGEMRGPFIGNVSHAGHSGRVNQMPVPEASFNTLA